MKPFLWAVLGYVGLAKPAELLSMPTFVGSDGKCLEQGQLMPFHINAVDIPQIPKHRQS